MGVSIIVTLARWLLRAPSPGPVATAARTLRKSRSVAALLWALAVLGLVWVPFDARAASPPEKIAVKVEGPKAQATRDTMLAALPSTVSVTEEGRYTAALARAGLPGGKMAHALTDPKLRAKLFKIAGKAVKGEELDGALLARVRGGPSGLEMALVFVTAEGDPSIDTIVPLGGSESEQKERIRAALEPVFPPKPAEEAPAAGGAAEPGDGSLAAASELGEPAESGSDEGEGDEGDGGSDYVPNRPGTAIVGLGASFALAGRFFSYREPGAGSTNLWPYDAFSAPAGHFTLELYPAATSGVPFLQDLGITGAYTHIFGWTSHTEDEQASFSTRWQQLWAGLRYRIRTGEPDANPAIFGLSARFGMQAFVLDADNAAAELIADEVPSAEYLLMGGQIDVRIPMGERFAMIPALGGYGVIDGGELYERFASASYFGFDGSLDVAVVLGVGFELRAGAEYTGLFSWLEPDPSNAFVASGADDHYLAVRLGLGYLY